MYVRAYLFLVMEFQSKKKAATFSQREEIGVTLATDISRSSIPHLKFKFNNIRKKQVLGSLLYNNINKRRMPGKNTV
jgi:hypothetical protein